MTKTAFAQMLKKFLQSHALLVRRRNRPRKNGSGISGRFENPMLTTEHPDAPIVLIKYRTMQDFFLIAGRVEFHHLKDRARLKSAFDRHQKDGVKNPFYITSEHLFGDDGEGSADRSHPNDLGFRQGRNYRQSPGIAFTN